MNLPQQPLKALVAAVFVAGCCTTANADTDLVQVAAQIGITPESIVLADLQRSYTRKLWMVLT